MTFPNTSTASFGVRRLLSRGRLALALGWLALWLSTIAHAACALPAVPAASGGTISQLGTIDYASPLPHSVSDSGTPSCQQLLDAGKAAQSVAVPRASNDQATDLLSASALQPLIARGDSWFVANYSHHLPPPDFPLYLRTLRLLI